MVLQGQDNGKGRVDEGAFIDDLNDIFEADLGGEGVTMVNDWIPVISVPAVQLHATTSR